MYRDNNIKLFEVEILNKSIEVFKTSHVLESRYGGKRSRDHNLHKMDYKDIINLAIKYGLTSFRNKGRVVISFYDTDNIEYAILVELSDIITIISVYYSTYGKVRVNNFEKEKNRIKLYNYYTLDSETHSSKTTFIGNTIKKAKTKKHHNPIRKVQKVKAEKTEFHLDSDISDKDRLEFENWMDKVLI